jgi:hypothetical protein
MQKFLAAEKLKKELAQAKPNSKPKRKGKKKDV